MSTALVVREDYGTVEHLAIWAYDPISGQDSYATGRYVPLCAQERRHDRRWRIVDWLCAARQARLDRKPLCTRCQHALEQLIQLERIPDPTSPTATTEEI